MEERIKVYLEKQIQTDFALKEKYNADKIKKCVCFITNKAREYLKSQDGMIADEVVYKWARDFFNDEIEIDDKESDNIQRVKVETKKDIDLENKQLAFDW